MESLKEGLVSLFFLAVEVAHIPSPLVFIHSQYLHVSSMPLTLTHLLPPFPTRAIIQPTISVLADLSREFVTLTKGIPIKTGLSS